MATKQSTIDFLTEQMSHGNTITSRKMFGEYALYVNQKVFAFVCDDKLFIKPLESLRKHLKETIEEPAYPGSKNYFFISEDYWDDQEYLSRIATIMEPELPLPKPKKNKSL